MLRSAWVFIIATSLTLPAWAGPLEDKALLDAASKLDVAAITAALNAGANPSVSSSTARPMTPLGFAALAYLHEPTFNEKSLKERSLEAASVLFKSGAKLGFYDRDILFFPISQGNLPLVKLLVSKGASVTGDLDGYTPTELAKNYGQEDIYTFLVSKGGVPVDNSTAAQLVFIEAAGTGKVENMEKALKDGANINGMNGRGRTPLLAAVRSGVYLPSNAGAIWWLLDHGADPNQMGDSGFRGMSNVAPLHVFVVMNKAPMAGLSNRPDAKPLAEETFARLLKAGAKISGMDGRGRTPLHYAAMGDNVRAAEMLIKEGARVMARDNDGKTPLDYAESAEMIKLLKANGAKE